VDKWINKKNNSKNSVEEDETNNENGGTK